MLSGFHDTLIGATGAIPIGDIVRIDDERRNEHGVMLRRVRMRDGTSFDTFATENRGLLQRPVQLVPAQPGTSVVRAYVREEPPEILRTPVIAWALCLDGEVRAVTPNGVNDGLEQDTYVELPTGQIEAVGEWCDPCGFRDARLDARALHPDIQRRAGMSDAAIDTPEAAWEDYHAAALRAQAAMHDPTFTSAERCAVSMLAIRKHRRFTELLTAPVPTALARERNRLAVEGAALLTAFAGSVGPRHA